ncbi:MAG: hypothetical protein AB7P12_16650, partial [Alphaproteobacteria bacterium]
MGLIPPAVLGFFGAMDRAIRSKEVTRIIKAVESFRSLAFREESEGAESFWQSIEECARQITIRRRAAGRLQSVWGVTPIVGLQFGAAADRRLGIPSETLVFDTYYVTSEFDINLSDAQTQILSLGPDLFHAFRRCVFGWALLSYDIFHLYNDRGLYEPAGGYGHDAYGIA